MNITGTNTSGTIMQSVNYLYAANGQKLRKQTRIDHQLSATYDYAGRFIYSDLNGDNTQLSYLMANQGRIILNEDGSSGYEYAIKDHLGNTRITFVTLRPRASCSNKIIVLVHQAITHQVC